MLYVAPGVRPTSRSRSNGCFARSFGQQCCRNHSIAWWLVAVCPLPRKPMRMLLDGIAARRWMRAHATRVRARRGRRPSPCTRCSGRCAPNGGPPRGGRRSPVRALFAQVADRPASSACLFLLCELATAMATPLRLFRRVVVSPPPPFRWGPPARCRASPQHRAICPINRARLAKFPFRRALSPGTNNKRPPLLLSRSPPP